MLVITKRRLSLGSLSAARTTSALITTRCGSSFASSVLNFCVSVFGLAATLHSRPAGNRDPHYDYIFRHRHHIFQFSSEHPETPAPRDGQNHHPGEPEWSLPESSHEWIRLSRR